MIRSIEEKDFEVVQSFLNEFHTTIKKDDNTKYLVYELSGVIVGVLEFVVLYERSEINYIYVDRNYRRRNIATKLLEKMITLCEEASVENITLEVNENNQNAIYFYQNALFNEVARRRHYYKDGDAILMERSLIK